jgi:hypothetical protein
MAKIKGVGEVNLAATSKVAAAGKAMPPGKAAAKKPLPFGKVKGLAAKP